MKAYHHARALEYDDFWLRHLVAEERVRFDARAPSEERVLGGGSRWRVFKRVFDADELAAELGDGRVLHDGRWFSAVAA